MTRLMLAVGALLVTASGAMADGVALNADGLKWQEAAPLLPKGAQFAVVSGDPSKNELYVIRLRMPAGYKVPAHRHPTAEYVTVLSGNFHIGMGDKLDQSKGMELRSGGFAEAPAEMNHYAWASSETVVQVHGPGPFAITYVDPAEDPRKTQ